VCGAGGGCARMIRRRSHPHTRATSLCARASWESRSSRIVDAIGRSDANLLPRRLAGAALDLVASDAAALLRHTCLSRKSVTAPADRLRVKQEASACPPAPVAPQAVAVAWRWSLRKLWVAPVGADGAADALLPVAAHGPHRADDIAAMWPAARALLSEAQRPDRTDAMAVESPAVTEREDPQWLPWFSRMDAAGPRRMLWRP
jgi:hypothetical protein